MNEQNIAENNMKEQIIKRRIRNRDITNQRFGRLVVIERVERKNKNVWLCKCDCGKEKVISLKCLIRKTTQSCGCLQKERVKIYHDKTNNLLGMKFGRLTVLDKINSLKKGRFWKCKCECGKFTEVNTECLKSGNTRSCGCLWMEKCNNIPYEERNPQLDMFRPVLANLNKIKREINISLGDLKNQWDKQRGICVYSGIKLLLPEWNIPRKHPKMASLDRIDSNKGYIKNNIQFVSVIANYAKNEMTNEEMIYFCKEVAKFWRNKC